MSDWLQAEEIELPSGKTVTLRRPHLMDLIEAGFVPTELTNRVVEASDSDDFEPSSASPEELVEIARVIRHTIAAALVDPPITPEQVRLIPREDRDELWAHLSRKKETDALASFRDIPEGGPDGTDGADVRP